MLCVLLFAHGLGQSPSCAYIPGYYYMDIIYDSLSLTIKKPLYLPQRQRVISFFLFLVFTAGLKMQHTRGAKTLFKTPGTESGPEGSRRPVHEGVASRGRRDLQTLRPSDPQTFRPSDPQTFRPSDPQTLPFRGHLGTEERILPSSERNCLVTRV